VTVRFLVVGGGAGASHRAYLYTGGVFVPNTITEAALPDAVLRARVSLPNGELTYTCTPPGSGTRIALDQDEDGFYNRDETVAGSDPSDASSTP
jgi:hypothetical protein